MHKTLVELLMNGPSAGSCFAITIGLNPSGFDITEGIELFALALEGGDFNTSAVASEDPILREGEFVAVKCTFGALEVDICSEGGTIWVGLFDCARSCSFSLLIEDSLPDTSFGCDGSISVAINFNV
jgi:hypothetical protein